MKVLLESVEPGLWSLDVIKIEIFLDQCDFSGLWQKQVLIQQQACILSAALMALHATLTPPAPPATSAGAGVNEMSQRRCGTDTCGKVYQS